MRVERVKDHFSGFVTLQPLWMISEELLQNVKIKAKFVNLVVPSSPPFENKYDFNVTLKKIPHQPVFFFNKHSEGLANSTTMFSVTFEASLLTFL
jgi:hypothetical protein